MISSRGLTVMEILVAAAVAALLVIITVIPLNRFREAQLLNGAAENIVALLAAARGKTLASLESSPYGVQLAADRLTLFKGAAYPGPGQPENQELVLDPRLTLSVINLNGGGAAVVFKRLSGATDEYGKIILSLVSDPGQQKTVTIEPTGATSVN